MADLGIYQSIIKIMPGLAQAEKRVAKTLLSDFPAAGLSTMAKLAQMAQVSDPTIMRFIRKLGFQSFRKFSEAMRVETSEKITSPLSFQPDKKQLAETNNSASRFSDRLIANIANTMNQISDQEIDSILDLLINKKSRIFIIAGFFTFSMAHHLYFHLAKFRPHVQLIEQLGWKTEFHLLDVKPGDVMVAFDVRRYSKNLLNITREFHNKGGTVILLTDQWLSPIASISKHVFACKIDSESRWDSLAGLLMVVELLMHRYTEREWAQVKVRLKEAEEIDTRFNKNEEKEDIPHR